VSRTLAVLAAALGGGLAGMQAPINSRLGRTVGTIQAATFSFLVGTIALLLIASLASGGLGALGRVGRVPWWALLGGLCGAVYVTMALLAVRTLGASGVTVAIVAGQLTIAITIDRFGLFGLAKQHIDAARIAGLVLVLIGVVLVVRR
jgi:bacterial/archaeal transporter family-2 protein